MATSPFSPNTMATRAPIPEPVALNPQHPATSGGSDLDTPSPTSCQRRDPYHPKKKFSCTWPGCTHAQFTCPHNVAQHIREQHTYDRPFKCTYCAASGTVKAFARQGTLNRHERDIHKVHRNIHHGRGRKPTVGFKFEPQVVRPKFKGFGDAGRQGSSHRYSPRISPAQSNIMAWQFPVEPSSSPSPMAMADEQLPQTGRHSLFHLSPQQPPHRPVTYTTTNSSTFQLGPNVTPPIGSTKQPIDTFRTIPGATYPTDDTDSTFDEIWASLEQTSRSLSPCRHLPVDIQQPTVRFSLDQVEAGNDEFATWWNI